MRIVAAITARTLPRIAVFSGATATIQNSPPLVSSEPVLRAQSLAAPVTVYVRQFSAHPLERDAARLYGPPDGYVDGTAAYREQPSSPSDIPVYKVTLRPEDGLFLLPYVARRADGAPWDAPEASPNIPFEQTRQTFYPDASRVFEEIDRFGIDAAGRAGQLSRRASYDFYRIAPPGGYTRGLPATERTDVGHGDIAPEQPGADFWPYRPLHLRSDPPRAHLATLTNSVTNALRDGHYEGALWLEGSPDLEETLYWLHLVIDTTLPICGCASQRPHGSLSNDGDRNIVDAVDYIASRVWADADGADMIGGVAILDEIVYAAREVQKVDARPGGYLATGGHGGIVGTIGRAGNPMLTYVPVRKRTSTSDVRVSVLPETVLGVRREGALIQTVPVQIRDASGALLADAIPNVSFAKRGRYSSDDASGAPDGEVEILARIRHALEAVPLAGFVAEGTAPFGRMTREAEAALAIGTFSGMPVVNVGRGNAGGMVPIERDSIFISGSNLTATKARLLLMAALLKLGALPPAADPTRPTDAERAAVRERVAQYQSIFDTH